MSISVRAHDVFGLAITNWDNEEVYDECDEWETGFLAPVLSMAFQSVIEFSFRNVYPRSSNRLLPL